MGLPLERPRLDRADYLAWEESQPTKHEYVAGEVFAMVGARQSHVLVAVTLALRLKSHLQGTRCRTFVSDMKLDVQAADAFFYPDVMVSCDDADRQREQALQAPVFIAEVLSDSTAAYDRGTKFAAYRLLPSLQEFLLVDIERRQAELFRRQPSGWVLLDPAGQPATLTLQSVELVLRVADLFEDLQPRDPAAPQT
jgi:Uma2 family endonuclease